MRQCAEPPPDQLLQAVTQFNDRDWFECHETLEDLWMGEDGEARKLYQGILQVAVALHHWRNGNFGGAMSLLKSGMDLLGCVQPVCQRVDVAGLLAAASRVRAALARLGKDRMGELEASLIPRLLIVAVQEEDKRTERCG